MRGAVALGIDVARRLDLQTETVGSLAALVDGGWLEQLEAASPNLQLFAQKVSEHLDDGDRFILTMGRCAASVATLPLIAQRFPDAAIVWFDAHGDSNVPMDGPQANTSYLGGMVITGAAGEWDTGFGNSVDLANVILVGARDLDPSEHERIEKGQIRLVSVGPDLGHRLEDAVKGRRVYIHLDCDVMSAGLIATEYQVPDGFAFADLREAFETLAKHDVLGLEITEYEDRWPDGKPNQTEQLLDAIQPVLEALGSR